MKKIYLITALAFVSSLSYSQTTVIDASGTNNGANPIISQTNGLLRFGSAGSGEAISSNRFNTNSNQYGLDLYTAFQKRMSITSNGFVGINSQIPNARLHIVGNLQIDGDQSTNWGSPQIRSVSSLNFYPDIDGSGDSKISFYSGGVSPVEIFTINSN